MSEGSDVAGSYADTIGARMYFTDQEPLEGSAQSFLERLNEDCWRAVLDYVPVKDILNLAQLCSGWQNLVHSYFQEVGICLISISDKFEHNDATILKMHSKNRIHIVNFNAYYQNEVKKSIDFMEKWGQYVVYTYCPASSGFLARIARNCPNVKSISIEMNGFETGDLTQELVEFVERLERIAFMDYTCMDNIGDTLDLSDQEIGKSVFAYIDDQVHSYAFWRNFRPNNLKSVTFRGGYDFQYFLSAVECYPNVTELVLQGDVKNVHLLFEKVPKLERLCVMAAMRQVRLTQDVGEWICDGLRCLQQFTVWQSRVVYSWPELLLTRLEGLQSIHIRCIGNLPFILDICQAHGQTLTHVRLIDNYINDEQLVTLVRSCPKLQSLYIRLCINLSSAFLTTTALAVQGRPTVLRVHLGEMEANAYDNFAKNYPELIVEVEPPIKKSLDYEIVIRPRQYIWGLEDSRCRDRSIKLI